MRNYLLLIILFFGRHSASLASNSDSLKSSPKPADQIILPDDPILASIDSMMALKYLVSYGEEYRFFDSAEVYSCFETNSELDESLLQERLKQLDGQTPFELIYNDRVRAFINLYINKRPQVSAKVLGLSSLYFPLFEERLDKHNLPKEFKYLAVVESALNPTARSSAGALGLWQFMYGTGKIYGLKQSSYMDERLDPHKATEAACEYFKYLYKIYGNWDLVLAAYNCGPGNVNKAIRRSGGRRNYWEIYRYLPRETRGYVPAFIAVNYMMNYAETHNIFPLEPVCTYFETDTLHMQGKVYLKQLSQQVQADYELVKFLNPAYRFGIVPDDGQTHVIRLPLKATGVYVSNETRLKEDVSTINPGEQEPVWVWKEVRKTHYVRSGEYLGLIARKYGTSVHKIQTWNNLSGSNIRVGQRLLVYSRERVMVEGEPKPVPSTESTAQKEKTTAKNPAPNLDFIYYTIQNGDTLWDISKNKGIPLNKLKELNTHLNTRRLKPGDKIIVGLQG